MWKNEDLDRIEGGLKNTSLPCKKKLIRHLTIFKIDNKMEVKLMGDFVL